MTIQPENYDEDSDIASADEPLARGVQGSLAGAPRPVRSPRTPGLTGNPQDWERAYTVLREQVRRERPELSESEAAAETDKRYEELSKQRNEHVLTCFLRLAPESSNPRRWGIREHIEAKAVRGLPEWRELERTLKKSKMGRPADRTLPVGLFACAALGSARPELRGLINAFAGSNDELDWAYLDTVDRNSVAAMQRDETAVRRSFKNMLSRNDPGMTIDLNLKLFERIAANIPDAGRWLTVDATPIEGPVVQASPVNPQHAACSLRDTGATPIFHGGGNTTDGYRAPKFWVGWKLMVISDLKTGLPLTWRLIDNGGEFKHLVPMLTDLLKRSSLLQPDCIVGDSEYDRSTRVAFDLEHLLGIHPVFPLRDSVSHRFEHARTKGVPRCSAHGPMKLKQTDDFAPTGDPGSYEQDFERARKNYKARIRWGCEHCAATATTRVAENPRLYTYYPREGEHRRYAMRVALMLRRNNIESLFSQLKHRGIGGRAQTKPRWVSEPRHMEWLCFAALLGITARRYAHESSLYEQAADEARQLTLFKAGPRSSAARSSNGPPAAA